jgi:hypothetical protein
MAAVHMEEKLANLPRLIGRPLKMLRFEGARTGEHGLLKQLKEGGGGDGYVRGFLCSFTVISRASL